MSVFVTLETKVKSGSYDTLRVFLQKNMSAVRGFSGALNVSILHNKESEAFLIFEEWVSEKHHGAYIQEITKNGVMARLLAFLDYPPAVTYYSKEPF